MSDSDQNPHRIALLTLEYEQLKDEQVKRIIARDGLIGLTLASVVLGMLKATSAPLLLLLLPPALNVLGWTYLMNDVKVTAIGRYIRNELTPRLQTLLPGSEPFAWEGRHLQLKLRRRHKIGQLVADLVLFCGTATGALTLLYAQYTLPIWATAATVMELTMIVGLAVEIIRCSGLASRTTTSSSKAAANP